MKYFIGVLMVLGLFSCSENDQKKDTETNTYYAKYVYIYNNYDSLGFEKSNELLDEYIAEFPNAQNAYLFKAYLMAKNGKLNETVPLFLKAQSYDSLNIELYQQWASILLYDSSQVLKAEEVNNIGLQIDSTDILCRNNNTWILLYQNKNLEALENALSLVQDTLAQKNIYYRALVLSSIAAQNDSIYSFYLPQTDSVDRQNFDKLKRKETSFPQYYKTL